MAATVVPGMEIGRLCADVLNAVHDYCDDGVDAFQRCLVNAPGLEPATLEIIQQGSNRLHGSLTGQVLASLSLFEQLCSAIVNSTPEAVMQEPIADSNPFTGSSATLAETQQLESQLAEVHAQLLQVDKECSDLTAQALELDAQLSSHGLAGPLQAMAASVRSACDSGALEDLRAIAHARQQLVPLLEHAGGVYGTRSIVV